MSHAEVYKAFRQYFPTYVGENIDVYKRQMESSQVKSNNQT